MHRTHAERPRKARKQRRKDQKTWKARDILGPDARAGHRVLDALASIQANGLAATVFRESKRWLLDASGGVRPSFQSSTSISGLVLILRELDDALLMLVGE